MLDDLTFMMGEFEALIPADRRYAKNHMWAQAAGGSDPRQWQFGFTAYAVRLLQDVYFLEWDIEAPVPLKAQQKIGFIESSKAESDLFAPLAGTLTTINEELLGDPSAINTDKYTAGWLFAMEADETELLSPEQYIEHLEAVWETTQRTIKGQLNE